MYTPKFNNILIFAQILPLSLQMDSCFKYKLDHSPVYIATSEHISVN